MRTLILASSLLSLAIVGLPACSGDDVGTSATASAGSTSSTSASSSSSSSTSSTSTTSAETDSGSASSDGSSSSGTTTESSSTTGASDSSTTSESSASDSDSSSTTDATTGGGSALMYGLQDPMVYANCQPIVADDPLHASWTVMADNAAGMDPATLKVSDVSVTFDPDGVPDTFAITLAPASFGPTAAGAVESYMTTKEETPGGLPACDHCDEPVLFEMTWTVNDEAPQPGSVQATLSCVY